MQTSTQTLDLSISGMTCAHCANTVARALRAVPGVQDAAVDLASERARVTLRAGAAADAEALRRAVQETGYDAIPMRREA